MDTSSGFVGRDRSHVNDKIADLPPEDIRSTVIQTVRSIWVTINETEPVRASEVGCSFNGRDTVWVSDDLCVVVIDDG